MMQLKLKWKFFCFILLLSICSFNFISWWQEVTKDLWQIRWYYNLKSFRTELVEKVIQVITFVVLKFSQNFCKAAELLLLLWQIIHVLHQIFGIRAIILNLCQNYSFPANSCVTFSLSWPAEVWLADIQQKVMFYSIFKKYSKRRKANFS